MKSNKNKIKVAVAMSGGVDSSVAAALLKKQGYDCIGIFMKFWSETRTSTNLHEPENKCCSADAYQDAKRVAHQLGIPIYTLNMRQNFKRRVVDYFLKQHQLGNTPNPCIQCNKFIKFGEFLKRAKSFGCNFIATGHYVVKSKVKSPRPRRVRLGRKKSKVIYKLLMAKDKNKDQSYFLYALTQNQLKQILFPLANYTKNQVRTLAKKFNLPVYQKPESQEICFIPEKYPDNFLKRHLKLRPGPIITNDGKIVGEHQGLALYTLGQRRGLKIGGLGPFYVMKKDFKKNALIISKNKNDVELYHHQFSINQVNWISSWPKFPLNCQVRIRYQAPLIKCQLKKIGAKIIVQLHQPQRAITPGQSAVFYQGKKMLGGGIISTVITRQKYHTTRGYSRLQKLI